MNFCQDYIPILRYTPSWFPGASFKSNAAIWKKTASEFVNKPFDVVKNRMVSFVMLDVYGRSSEELF